MPIMVEKQEKRTKGMEKGEQIRTFFNTVLNKRQVRIY